MSDTNKLEEFHKKALGKELHDVLALLAEETFPVTGIEFHKKTLIIQSKTSKITMNVK